VAIIHRLLPTSLRILSASSARTCHQIRWSDDDKFRQGGRHFVLGLVDFLVAFLSACSSPVSAAADVHEFLVLRVAHPVGFRLGVLDDGFSDGTANQPARQ